MEGQWPPPGHGFATGVHVALDGQDPYDFDLSAPSASMVRGGVDMVTARVARLGGPSGEDEVFRRELYAAIGAVVVAGGHVESAMKRVLLVASAMPRQFDGVDWTWSKCVDKLHKVRPTAPGLKQGISDALRWAVEQRAKERRDDVVHAYWWNYSGVGVQRGRFTRSGESYSIVGSLDGLREDARILFEFAHMLDDLVQSDWPQARLPKAATPGQ